MSIFRDINSLDRVLADMGRALQDAELTFELFIIGGAAVMLHDQGSTPTGDVDVAALIADGTIQPAYPLPDELQRIADAVRTLHELTPGWLNAAAAAAFDGIVTPEMLERASARVWGGLTLHLPARIDLLQLKLRAALRRGEKGKRYQRDLAAMRPSDDELQTIIAAEGRRSDTDAARERLGVVADIVKALRDGNE